MRQEPLARYRSWHPWAAPCWAWPKASISTGRLRTAVSATYVYWRSATSLNRPATCTAERLSTALAAVLAELFAAGFHHLREHCCRDLEAGGQHIATRHAYPVHAGLDLIHDAGLVIDVLQADRFDVRPPARNAFAQRAADREPFFVDAQRGRHDRTQQAQRGKEPEQARARQGAPATLVTIDPDRRGGHDCKQQHGEQGRAALAAQHQRQANGHFVVFPMQRCVGIPRCMVASAPAACHGPSRRHHVTIGINSLNFGGMRTIA